MPETFQPQAKAKKIHFRTFRFIVPEKARSAFLQNNAVRNSKWSVLILTFPPRGAHEPRVTQNVLGSRSKGGVRRRGDGRPRAGWVGHGVNNGVQARIQGVGTGDGDTPLKIHHSIVFKPSPSLGALPWEKSCIRPWPVCVRGIGFRLEVNNGSAVSYWSRLRRRRSRCCHVTTAGHYIPGVGRGRGRSRCRVAASAGPAVPARPRPSRAGSRTGGRGWQTRPSPDLG